ncbi:hypothetical protein QEN19_003286 [Hanseniaspora menglaensis]
MSGTDKGNWLGGNMFISSVQGNKENIKTSLSKLDNYVVFDSNETMELESRGRGRGRSRSISESDFSTQLNVPKNNRQNNVNTNLLSTFLLGASQGKRSTSLSASRDGNMMNKRRLSDNYGNNSVNTNVSAMGLLNFNKNSQTKSNIAVSSVGHPKLSDLLSSALSLNRNFLAKETQKSLNIKPQTKKLNNNSNSATPVIEQQDFIYSNDEIFETSKLAGDSSQISSTTSTKVDLVQPLNTPKSISHKFEINYVEGSLNEEVSFQHQRVSSLVDAVPSEFEQLCEDSVILSQISSESACSGSPSVIQASQFKATMNQLPPQSMIYKSGHTKQLSVSSQDLQNDLMILETQQRHHQRQKSLRLVQSVNDLQTPTQQLNDHHPDTNSSMNGMGIIGYTYADIVDKRMSHISNLSGLSWEEVPIAVRDAHKQLTSNEESVSIRNSNHINHNRGQELRKAKSTRALVEKEEEYIDAEMQLNLLKQQQVELKMKQMELQIQELKLTNDKLRYAMTDQRQVQDKMIYETLHDTLRTKENMETEMNKKVGMLENKVQEYKDLISKLTDQQQQAVEKSELVDHSVPESFFDQEKRGYDESTVSSLPQKSISPVTRSNSLYVKKNRLSKIDPEQLEEMTKSRNSSRIEHNNQITNSKMKRMSTISSTSSSNNGGYNKKKGVNLNIPIRVDSSSSF